MREDGTVTFLLADHLGSTSVTTDSTGVLVSSMLYTAFGETRSSTGMTASDYLYTGQREESEIGLYFFNARFYDAALARFISADTIVPQPGDPLAWDRYAYGRNNPIKYNDPSGHWVETVLDIAFIAYDIYDIKTNGLTWVSGLSLAADVAGALLPVVTGAGLAVRALSHTDDVVDAAKAADTIIDAVKTTDKADGMVDIASHSEGLVGVSQSTERSSTLFHYTNEKGLNGILNSNELLPSLKSVSPRDVRYGEGQYLSDIVPGLMTPNQISRQLVGNPFQGNKFTNYVEINVAGLNVVKGGPGVYLVPNTKPLDLTKRIISYGKVIAK